MKGIMNFFFASALFVALMAAAGGSAWAQSAQKQLDPRLQTQMAELKAKMQKLEPNSNDYKATKAEYDRLLSKEQQNPKATATQKSGHRAMAVQAKAKPATTTPKASGTTATTKDDSYAKLKAYEAAHPINEPNKRIAHIRMMERQRDFYLQNGDAATANKVSNDIANFKAEARKACSSCWMGEGEKPVGQ